MIEHLILLLVESLVKNQQAEKQTELRTSIPEVDRLRTQPAEMLAESEVVIPAARSRPLAIVLGAVCGFAVFGLALLAGVVAQEQLNWVRKISATAYSAVMIGCVALFFAAPAFFFAIWRQVLRGGELVMRRTGAEFRHRGSAVLCPWGLFRAPGFIGGDSNRVVVPCAPAFVERVELVRNEGIVEYGVGVRLKSFRFLSETEIELRNVYAADVREVAQMLQELGRRLG